MLTPAPIAVHATDPARRSAARTLGAASSHDRGHPRSQRERGPAGPRRARTAAVTAASGPAMLAATRLNWEDAPGVASHTPRQLAETILGMTPNRKKTGRPSKGPRRFMSVPVGARLRHLINEQAATEGKYVDALLNEIVAEYWPTWPTRGEMPAESARLLLQRRGGNVGLRIPLDRSDEIFAVAGDKPATDIVAELIARHLPERIERFRSPTAPQQEELALSS